MAQDKGDMSQIEKAIKLVEEVRRRYAYAPKHTPVQKAYAAGFDAACKQILQALQTTKEKKE